MGQLVGERERLFKEKMRGEGLFKEKVRGGYGKGAARAGGRFCTELGKIILVGHAPAVVQADSRSTKEYG